MSDRIYLIEVNTDESLSDGELDELRQVVVDFLSPGEGTTVEISELSY